MRNNARVRRTLGPYDVHVRYRLTHDVDQINYAKSLQTLSSDERERAARFVFPRDRFAFAAAHSLLREALSDYENVPPDAWTFARNAYGKPMLANPYDAMNFGFSLAHTDSLVACAVCRGSDVGVDVESLNPMIHALDIAHRYFSPDEVIGLQACAETERQLRFIELWTLKEAYVKAIGEGLSHPLHTFGFALDGPSSLRFEPAARAEQSMWEFALFEPSARHRMAVAVRCMPHEKRQITVWASDGDCPVATVLRTSVHDAKRAPTVARSTA